MNNERHVKIESENYTYSGRMTKKELLAVATKHNILSIDVTIGGMVMYGWDELDLIWSESI